MQVNWEIGRAEARRACTGRFACVALVLVACGMGQVRASSSVEGTVREFGGPTGTSERCVALTHMPGAVYGEVDEREEQALCAIDFNDGAYGLCPKVFSTSPGTLVYRLAGAQSTDRVQTFEQGCIAGGVVRQGVDGPPVSYKMSVNARNTSGTFVGAALIYYHFARYFDATAHVPVAVLRTMDRSEHRRRVSERGLALSAAKSSLRMNHAGWQTLHAAEGDPSSYTPQDELFTADGQIYGVLLRPTGTRYNEAVNGTRASGWGEGQNRDFQQTAAYRALRSDKPLRAAIDAGLAEANRNPVLAKATRGDGSPQQIVFWMSDLVDITLLDFIFSQQDRIGNIDYVPYWHWVQDGEVKRRAADGPEAPADIAGFSPQLLKRTELADNDAGVRVTYANFAKRTGMLEGLRHYRASTYERLIQLHRDFASGGPLHDYVRRTFGLSNAEFRQTVANTAAAAGILHESCVAGRLAFDVQAEEFFTSGDVTPKKVDCGSL